MAFIPLTAAAFDSGWFSLSSQAGAASGKDVAHGLGAVPSTVKVSVKAVDTSLLGSGACCDGPYHVYEQRQARGGVLTYFCSFRERPAAALVTPEGSAYRALTKVATQM